MRVLAAVTLVATSLAACARPDVELIPREDLPADVYGTPTPARVASLPDRGPVWFVRDGQLVSVPRRLPEAGSLPEALVRGLLLGPRGATQSAIPDDTRVIAVRVDGSGVATADLSEEFERSAPGEELALRVAQVVFTLTEAPQIVAVAFSIEGRAAGVIAGNRHVVTRPVTRDDYRRFEPRDEEVQSGTSSDSDDSDTDSVTRSS